MTSYLSVVEGKSKGAALALGGKAIFVVGSGSQADLVLDDPGVAPAHVKIYLSGTEPSVFDVSGLGFLHNGKRSLKTALRDDDVIQLGAHRLRLGSEAPGAPSAGEPGPPRAAVHAELQAVKGNDAGRTFDLTTKDVFVIGRGTATDITVWDIRASRVHCRIDRDPEGYLITDLNASNGTFVNGHKIDTHRLKAGDEIKVGNTVLQYVQR